MVESGGGDVTFQSPNPGVSANVGAKKVPTEHITGDRDKEKGSLILICKCKSISIDVCRTTVNLN